jgi:multiple sugar transport system permease protein
MKVRRFAPLLYIAPGMVLTLVILTYPIVDLLRLSVHEVGTFGGMGDFLGALNYRDMVEDDLFVEIVVRTFYWTFFVVAGTVIVSVPVALILNEDFYGKRIARGIIMLPWAISLAMTAVIWKWVLNPDYGMLNHLLMSIGLIDHAVGWLADASTAFPIEIAIGILVSIPFTVSIFLGGLSSIPVQMYEAATLEGAGYFQKFRSLTLPMLKPFINIAIVLNVIYVFNSFPIIWVLTEGGPSNSTDILPTYLYKVAFRDGDIGLAAALSIMMLGILLVFTIAYAIVAMRKEEISE